MSVVAISSAICETVKGRAILVHRTQREIGTTRRIGKTCHDALKKGTVAKIIHLVGGKIREINSNASFDADKSCNRCDDKNNAHRFHDENMGRQAQLFNKKVQPC